MVTVTVLKVEVVMQVMQYQIPSGKQEVSLINIERSSRECETKNKNKELSIILLFDVY